jgi:hypothetical protein
MDHLGCWDSERGREGELAVWSDAVYPFKLRGGHDRGRIDHLDLRLELSTSSGQGRKAKALDVGFQGLTIEC